MAKVQSQNNLEKRLANLERVHTAQINTISDLEKRLDQLKAEIDKLNGKEGLE